MKIIALESSGMTASVAVAEDDGITAEYTINYKKTHSQTLLPMLDEISRMIQLDLNTVDAVGISGGPGSFTGLRIGSATAKGIGLALNIPLINVPTLKGMAWNFWGNSSIICPMIDARREQVYTALFRFDGEDMTEAAATAALPVAELIKQINEAGSPVILMGDGAQVYAQKITEQVRVPYQFAPSHLNYPSAAGIAACAIRMYRKGITETAAMHRPDYLKASQAEREREARLAK